MGCDTVSPSLIAAAPDMLAALKAAAKWDEREWAYVDYRESILPLIEAAIAKAEGRS